MVGLPGMHLHDLRRAETPSPNEGASLRENMERMGHSSTRALIYQHSSDGRQRALADAVGERAALRSPR